MIEFDAVAEQHQKIDGMPLIDYLPVGLPIYLLTVDSLVSEKRNLMPVEEFILKAVQGGVRSSADVVGILGLGDRYGARVIESLSNEEYLTLTPQLALRPKGVAVLSEAGERQIFEKAISLAWNPLTQSVVKTRLTLELGPALALERTLRLAPPSTRLPALIDLPLEQLPGNQLRDGEQVVRYLSVLRRALRYIPAVLLLYARGKGVEPLARVAIDGVIDHPSSDAIAKHEMLPRLGLDSLFNRRSGVMAVDQRVKPLNILPGNGSLVDLLTLKSKLQLGIAGLERQDSAVAAAKLDAKKAELATVQQQLEQIPVRSLLPFEVPQLVDYALQKAKREVLITTTLPVEARLTPMRQLLLDQALKRGVKVRILISDRPAEDEWAKGPGLLLRKLNDLATIYANLDVSFLKDTDRVVFEVKADDATLGVSNEPSLGLRSREPLARAFSGYQLSGAKSVLAYTHSHLTMQALGVIGKIKIPAAIKKKDLASPKG
ncbi:hypothetical protein EJP69_07445 [Variovorax gossypii]|uniref:Uncharacterized protein n=1 Tax=Variovorax gossypii TaxID=1679495 RepID=A0A431TU25_9BURK|nr:hypothetical protein [Variovorax gossypii]RTQ37548.1 hypothetical protein EJP69_07445 [Variovorax gossypii]